MLVRWTKHLHVLLYFAATGLVTGVTFLMLITSEPYDFAKEFVTQDPRVLKVTGNQSESRFSPFKGFRYVFGEASGEANFAYDVAGERGRFDIRVTLEKRQGRWNVSSAWAISGGEAASQIMIVGQN